MYAIDIKYTREFLAGDTVGIGEANCSLSRPWWAVVVERTRNG
jgi:hypothetical protein